MTSRSVDVSGIGGLDGLKAKLLELATPELANKLVEVYAQSVDGFEAAVASAFTTFVGSCLDKCAAAGADAEGKDAPANLLAMDHVMSMLESDVVCMLLTMSARVAVGARTSGSGYVGHAMRHYEQAAADQIAEDRHEAIKGILGALLDTNPPARTAPEKEPTSTPEVAS